MEVSTAGEEDGENEDGEKGKGKEEEEEEVFPLRMSRPASPEAGRL